MASKECLDCRGHLEHLTYDATGRYIVDDQECHTCEGTGKAPREKNPYWLYHEQIWSDGVDRSHRIREEQYGQDNPGRVRIVAHVDRCEVYWGQEFDDTTESLGAAMDRANYLATRSNTNGK